MSFGQKLRELRAEKAVTLEEAAEAVGMTKQGLSNWENAREAPGSVRRVKKLAAFFGVSLAEMVEE